MLAYTVRRLLLLIPVLFGMSIVTFAITYLIPGNPARIILGVHATEQAIANLEEQLGLNKPLYIQYLNYISNLLRGDLGTSIRTNSPIASELWPHLAATFELTIFAMLFATIIGVNAGIISAWKKNSWFD